MTNKSRSNISTRTAARSNETIVRLARTLAKIHAHEDHEAKTNAAQERRRVRVGWFRNDDTGETTPVYDTVPRPFGKNV